MSHTQQFLIALAISLVANPCFAHATSDAFLYLSTDDALVTGRWDVHLRDLDLAIGLDTDRDGQVTWSEIYAQREAIVQRLGDSLTVQTKQGVCSAKIGGLEAAERSDGFYASTILSAQCNQSIDTLYLGYRFLFDVDAQHKAFVVVSGTVGEHNAVISDQSGTVTFAHSEASLWQTVLDYFCYGVWHIWIGLDHIVFLVVLLLPMGRSSGTHPYPSTVRAVLGQTVRLVTSFSVAHSITLTLAALDILRLPSRWVESAIAASVILAAAASLVPGLRRHLVLLTFCFGLIHGLGFAGVLGELGLPTFARTAALAAFNIGVELGQLAIVALVIPVILIWGNSDFYVRRTVPAASASIALLAGVWLFERAFAL